MCIAVVSNTCWYLFNFRLNLMLALQAAGHTVVAVAPDDAYAQRIRNAGIAFEAVPISGGGTHPLRELQSVLRLGAVFRRHRVGLVLSYTPKGNLYSALASIALRVAFVPNVSGLGRAFIRKSLVTQIAKTLYRLTFGRAHRVFFQNLDDMAVFVDSGLVRAGQAERLPGSGVELSRFLPTPPVVRPADAPVFLLVARMLWDKGVGEYVDSARKVRALHPGARFQLLGFLDVANPSAIARTQVEAWVAEGVVDYLGPTDDVRPFLVQADCVVLPSYREGVPRTLLEAAATARPVITTDAPGCRDTVLDGETGFLCRPADALDLTEKLLRFIALAPEVRQAMGQRGRAFVEQNFDERLVIERYLSVVAEVAAGRAS
ncbi:N,N'-diacetylbacillosaminyl-diphospho-undecaprenol alpha-1,3-N-acetylgalactosaminyltransferase [Polaromonas vacuolata]|uniref:N, N'-diacetylbacillosaminyl-diphospho-undecaprenol alpha-1,3-N-acetylgalactosaminyltransferase n=1 Tax=Polaromonas vacuolata TaxID=37448 RepID=A0A6H2H7E6_9BURK|nr:glycosyltransferase family 4 protein [Polaromonas vacuolata]QJC55785.1 N,N'-diacetylbacillosaminyl-diphospho-undecaprenol alpha-1,3-N-acetylgalactosaminyltransferase [Polaromonas vacuolata]